MIGIDGQKEYYNARWGAFDRINRYGLFRAGLILRQLSMLTELPEAPRICDLGCGAGWFTNMLNAFGPTVGVDLSDVTRAQQRYPECQFVSANILEWECPPESFDVVVSVEVIEHLDTRPLQEKYLALVHRILKPGGYLMLTTPNARTLAAIQHNEEWKNQPVENWLDSAGLRRLCSKGFTVERLHSMIQGHGDQGSYRFFHSVKVQRAAAALGLGALLEWAAETWDYGLHLFIVARKH